jgi:hypothetical protein
MAMKTIEANNRIISSNSIEKSETESEIIKGRALQNLDDLKNHLHTARNTLNSLQLDCNRNRNHYLLCDKVIEEIQISEKILNTTDLTVPIKLSLEVKRLFSADKNLSTVIVTIVNSKRIFNSGAIAHLKLTV